MYLQIYISIANSYKLRKILILKKKKKLKNILKKKKKKKMRLFTDIYNGQEIFTDSFKFNYLYNEVAFEVQSSYIKKGGEVIDIGK